MHRCSSGFVLTLTLVLAAILTGCLGKSSSNPPMQACRASR